VAVLAIASLGFTACVCTPTKDDDAGDAGDDEVLGLVEGFTLDHAAATADLEFLTAAPHPSARIAKSRSRPIW
jgi:hypothetical protein